VERGPFNVGTMAHGNIHRNTIQSEKIRALFLAAHGAWVPLPEILALGIAQYNARIWQLRHEYGLTIENKTELGDDGIRHSWFRLVNSSAQSAPEPVKEKIAPADSATSKSDDWHERQAGKPRPSGHASDLPLFAEVQS
jgi:hypothetical protein